MQLKIACSKKAVELLLLSLASADYFTAYEPKQAGDAIDKFCDDYLSAWKTATGKLPRTDYRERWLVDQTFLPDLEVAEQRRERPEFYRAHVAVFNRVGRELADHTRRLEGESAGACKATKAAVALMSGMASRATELLQAYAIKAGAEVERRIYVSNITHHRELYGIAQSLWFGAFLRDVPTTVSVIRQAIEIRVRCAVNAFGICVNGKSKPLPVLQVLELLSDERDAKCVISWHIVKRLYKWANLYVHVGFQDYPWLSGFALALTKRLMCGIKEDGGGWSVDNAIRITKVGFGRVSEAVVAQAKKRFNTDDVKILAIPIHPRCKLTDTAGATGCQKAEAHRKRRLKAREASKR